MQHEESSVSCAGSPSTRACAHAVGSRRGAKHAAGARRAGVGGVGGAVHAPWRLGCEAGCANPGGLVSSVDEKAETQAACAMRRTCFWRGCV